MTKNYRSLQVKDATYNKLKQRKEVHGITYDELINELLDKPLYTS